MPSSFYKVSKVLISKLVEVNMRKLYVWEYIYNMRKCKQENPA